MVSGGIDSSAEHSQTRGITVFEHVTPIRSDFQIRCEPDFDSVIADALGYVNSDMYRHEHATRFAPTGEGVNIDGLLFVTRLTGDFREDVASAISLGSSNWCFGIGGDVVTEESDLETRELWLISRSRFEAFNEKSANAVIEGEALRALLKSAALIHDEIVKEVRDMRTRQSMKPKHHE